RSGVERCPEPIHVAALHAAATALLRREEPTPSERRDVAVARGSRGACCVRERFDLGPELARLSGPELSDRGLKTSALGSRQGEGLDRAKKALAGERRWLAGLVGWQREGKVLRAKWSLRPRPARSL